MKLPRGKVVALPVILISVALASGGGILAAEMQKTYRFNVFSGKPHRVDTYLSWSDDCVGQIPSATVVVKPKHGAITRQIEQSKISVKTEGTTKKNCFGTSLDGLSIYYSSDKGFRGKDTFKVNTGDVTTTYVMNVH